ncbi:hypothetical protein EI290_18300 [Hymenobacter metallilatus]|uniref:Uncharacterized protein n=1 Tax=Hymenobacter metallilatus TaxID=2493666 RepID=A0A3R9U7K8_9BACT|nr:hypothetical protein EI290_18300 [Hymenobacter metallilatus]
MKIARPLPFLIELNTRESRLHNGHRIPCAHAADLHCYATPNEQPGMVALTTIPGCSFIP